MAKQKTSFVCSSCGRVEPRWIGRCPECDEWNTFGEQAPPRESVKGGALLKSGALVPLDAIVVTGAERINTGFKEVNQTLGGGLVRGAGVLLGGEPGIGKSTLLLQICDRVTKLNAGKVLYVSGEENLNQIKLRADRLGIHSSIEIFAGSDLDSALKTIQNVKPILVVIDSAQTLFDAESGSIPGTINQVRRCCHEIIGLCKDSDIACFIVAHVTKDGSIAGPKTIEHLVDAVLYFEQGDNDLRLLRAVKNRFGAVDELGLFQMTEMGLTEVDNKRGGLFFNTNPSPGSAVACAYEGSRVFFYEIQALSVAAKSGFSRIYSERIDASRALRVAAVLEKYAGIKFSDQDVYVNVSGGIKLTEPGIDLPLALALLSARSGLSLPRGLTGAGEVALSGEIRPPSHPIKRLKAAQEAGFGVFVGPEEGGNGSIRTLSAKNIKDLVKEVLSLKE